MYTFFFFHIFKSLLTLELLFNILSNMIYVNNYDYYNILIIYITIIINYTYIYKLNSIILILIISIIHLLIQFLLISNNINRIGFVNFYIAFIYFVSIRNRKIAEIMKNNLTLNLFVCFPQQLATKSVTCTSWKQSECPNLVVRSAAPRHVLHPRGRQRDLRHTRVMCPS